MLKLFNLDGKDAGFTNFRSLEESVAWQTIAQGAPLTARRHQVTRRHPAALAARCGDGDRCPTSRAIVTSLHCYPAEQAARRTTDDLNHLCSVPLADDTKTLGRSPESRSRSRPHPEGTVLEEEARFPTRAVLPGTHAHHLWPKERKKKSKSL